MKYIKSLFLIVLVALSFIGQAQVLPFEEYGFSPKVVTLSNGKYQEFHDLETVVEIGSVLYNTETKQIVGFAEPKELNLEDIQPYLVNRWVSPDPLSESYASLSPYNYVNNNPIRNIDPDGRYFESIIDIGFILYDVGEIAYDYITKGEVNPISVAALGADVVCLAAPIATGGGLAIRAGKEGVEQVAKHAAKEVISEGAEKMVKETAQGVSEKSTKNFVEKYEVGTFDNLQSRSKVGDGLDIHHAPQKHPAGQAIDGYDPKTAPSIALPSKEHKSLSTVKGDYSGNARSQLAKDVKDMRSNTNVPNQNLQDLIQLNKDMYPNSFKK